QLKNIEQKQSLDWAKYKGTGVNFLARSLTAFSHLNLPVGGGVHCINATKSDHGPSWRMIVSLAPQTEAYGIYPGGQSGNPGSKFFDDYIDKWVAGKYNVLWMMTKEDAKDKRVKWQMNFSN
ncbi:MAG TPA: penicillin acylase family protein, partial [Bacteroidia bacterium]|nr:penicillin acylase family protein [Bacteroidia bacterium]